METEREKGGKEKKQNKTEREWEEDGEPVRDKENEQKQRRIKCTRNIKMKQNARQFDILGNSTALPEFFLLSNKYSSHE